MRTLMLKVLIAALALFLLVSTALSCGGSSKNDQSKQPTQTQQTPGEQGSVPQTVLDMENDAEDAIDQVLAGGWDRVGSDARSLADTWKEFLSSSDASAVTADQRAAMDKAITDIKAAAQSQDALAARQAAN